MFQWYILVHILQLTLGFLSHSPRLTVRLSVHSKLAIRITVNAGLSLYMWPIVQGVHRPLPNACWDWLWLPDKD